MGIANNSIEGLNGILKKMPHIVFIHLNESAHEYFHMMAELHQYIKKLPLFIAVSKTKEYAYEAIKSQCYDYWLLPYNEYDIRKSLFKLNLKLGEEQKPPTLLLQSYKDCRYLNTEEIVYLQADNNATDFYMVDGSIISAYKTLKTFENNLPENFIRIHQSFIINISYISRINYGKGICTLKHNKHQLPFSKTYRNNIEFLKKTLSKNTISTLN
ncbi:DNA-binding response regulator, LytR/AlgR family [Arenibacter nanhaiticus]|uniref:DNA-binding response regulator, LytR/AlgR family n=2 Tax=Arenibacter nanhaiticus TaxID=558155 RepID=A0A1M6K0E9_9FLAO|nr:DNA-binding response regulator, LytR/AlgR family [Arenibacter nanhaiticus]